MQESRFVQCFTEFASSLRKEEIPDNLLAQYHRELTQVLDEQEILLAFRRWMLQSRFFPTVQELISCVRLTQEEIAAIEWQHILECMKSHGKTKLRLSQIGLDALSCIGGMTAIKNEPLGFLRRDFLVFHKAMHRKQVVIDGLPAALETPPCLQEETLPDWESFSQKEEWLAEIKSEGVPLFTQCKPDRIAFYEYAKNQGWLN